jgi:Tfp pilus assembly protein PilO
MWMLYAPPLAQTRRLVKERAQLRERLKEGAEILSRLQASEAPVGARLTHTPEILSQLQALAWKHKVRFLEIAPGQPVSLGGDQPVLLPVEIQLEGEYRALGEFLGSLRTFPPVAVLVKRIRLSREEQRLPNLRARVSLELAFLSDAHGS